MDPEYVNAPSRRWADDDDDDALGSGGGGGAPTSKQAMRWAKAGVEGARDLLLDVVDTLLGIEYEDEDDLLPVSYGGSASGSGSSDGGSSDSGSGVWSGSFGGGDHQPDSPQSGSQQPPLQRGLSGLLSALPGRGIRALKSLQGALSIPRLDQQQQTHQQGYGDYGAPLGEFDLLPCTRAQARSMSSSQAQQWPRARCDALTDLAPFTAGY